MQTVIRESEQLLTALDVTRCVGVEVVAVLSSNVCAHSQGWICRKTTHMNSSGK